MDLHEFYAAVARRADTAGTRINAAETARVLATAFDVLQSLPHDQRLAIVAMGLDHARQRADQPAIGS